MLSDSLFITVLLWILIVIVSALCLVLVIHLCIWLMLIFVGLTVDLKKDYEKPSKFYCKVFNIGYWSLYTLANVVVHKTGIEKVPFDRHFMFVSNHRSKFDNMIHSVALRKTELAYISKPENFSIPIGRRFMKRGCYIPIARHTREGIHAILRAIDLVKKDYASIGVFPEGTRSRTTELLPYKPGCFKIAEKAKCPIVVGVTQGTENIHKNYPWKKTDVYFDIIKVIYPEEFEGKSTVEISDYVYNLVKTYLDKGSI